MATLGTILSGIVNRSPGQASEKMPRIVLPCGINLEVPAMPHFGSWRELRESNKDHLQPWEPQWAVRETSLEHFNRRIRQSRQDVSHNRGVSFLIVKSNTKNVFGGISLFNVRHGSAKSGSIGYWLGEEHAGKGYMSAALNALCDYGFNHLQLERLEAACLPNNRRSINLLKRCQFTNEGLCRAYLQINGKREDHLLFARLKTDKL